MAIEYSKVGWDVAPYKYANPDNMNKMDTGIKSAVDGVNALEYVPKALASNGYGELSGGRNLIPFPYYRPSGHSSNGITYTYEEDGTIVLNGTATNRSVTNLSDFTTLNYIPLKDGVTYSIRFTRQANSGATLFYRYRYIGDDGVAKVSSNLTSASKQITGSDTLRYIGFDVGCNADNVCVNDTIKIMLEEGSAANLYEPYFPSNRELNKTQTELNDLKFLGWTVPRQLSVQNFLNSKGTFNQRVGRVDLGTLNWVQYGGHFYNYGGISYKTTANSVPFNGYTSKYATVSFDYLNAQSGDKCVGATNDGYLCIRDTSYSDATALRNSLSGQYLYYELGTSVEIAEGNEATLPFKVKTKTYSGIDMSTFDGNLARYLGTLNISADAPPTTIACFAPNAGNAMYAGHIMKTYVSSGVVYLSDTVATPNAWCEVVWLYT